MEESAWKKRPLPLSTNSPKDREKEREKEQDKSPEPPQKKARNEPPPPSNDWGTPWQEQTQTQSLLDRARSLEQEKTNNSNDAKNLPTWLVAEESPKDLTPHPVTIITDLISAKFPTIKEAAKTFGKVNLELCVVDDRDRYAIITFKNEQDASKARREITDIIKEGCVEPIEELTHHEITRAKNLAFFPQPGTSLDELRKHITFPTKALRVNGKGTVTVSFFRTEDLKSFLGTRITIGGKLLNKKASYVNEKEWALFATPIDRSLTNSMVRTQLESQGLSIKGVKVLREQETNRSKGCAIIKFTSSSERQHAYAKGAVVEGNYIT